MCINQFKKNTVKSFTICFKCNLAAKRKCNCIFSIIGSIVFITAYWNLSSIHFFKQEFRERTEYVRWTYYECGNNTQVCTRRLLESSHDAHTLQTCQMSCGALPIWPMPTGEIKLSNRKSISFKRECIRFRSLKAENYSVKRLLIGAADIFLSNLKSRFELRDANVENVDIFVTIIGNTTATTLRLDIDESYKLEITSNLTSVVVTIKSSTFFGARHALETLSQLIWFDDSLGLYRIVSGIKFEDIPAFKYRGIMLDTGSNYIAVTAIKRTLSAMAMNKLNTLHWHMTNEFSFPFCYKDCVQAMYGADSFNKIYSTEEIKEIINFASIRGIRVVLEINNHVDDIEVMWDAIFGTQTQFQHLKNSGMSSDKVFSRNVNGTVVLHGVPDMIHLGGVGVDNFYEDSNSDFIKNQISNGNGVFNAHDVLQNVTVSGDLSKILKLDSVVIWSETLNHMKNFSKIFDSRYFIAHVSSESNTKSQEKFLNNGFRVIISHSDFWFLNRLPIWSAVYAHRPWQNYTNKHIDKIVGAEVCLWTESVDENSLDSRLWPNAAAFAEVVWSNPVEMRVGSATDRLDVQRRRMVLSGIMASPIQPEWCSLNPGECS